MARRIWMRWNEVIHGGVFIHPTEIMSRTKAAILDFQSIHAHGSPHYDEGHVGDTCIATSVAPTYLPTYYFETKDAEGKVREINPTDGGVAANNPTLVALGEVSKEINRGSPDFFPIKPMDYGRFLDDTLSGVVSSVDVATTNNLDNLVKAGETLLKKPVSKVNLETGLYEVANH
ncbi:hypothetical protein FH972_015613 [Carpinus fangiana]|uniref:PNPLA domain-containing protein n=1 Tax=Carpinus fangiana TaxID=176857 RepID=A0A5N6RDC1_9ROSI|nr:hypothetical protein FH972_015613 [Carpinus fangiana]